MSVAKGYALESSEKAWNLEGCAYFNGYLVEMYNPLRGFKILLAMRGLPSN